MLNAPQVADLLLEIGRRMSLEGGNPYKAKAYMRAAESLRSLVTPLSLVIKRGALRDIPGVGAAIAQSIVELRAQGTNAELERARTRFPATLLGLAELPGLTPKAVAKLHDALGIARLADAETAARHGRLRGIKGLGASVERKILAGAAMLRAARGRMRIDRAEALLQHAMDALAREGVSEVTIAGDFRRGCELIGDLRLVATAPARATPTRRRLGPVTVDIVPSPSRGSALLYATGSAAHVRELEARARARSLTLAPDGIARRGAPAIGRSEAAIYRSLGLPLIAPELREGQGEIAAAKQRLPAAVTGEDLRGVLHVHTDFSDGANTLAEMAEAARARGYRYLGVSDHSRSAHYARGLSIADVARQHAAVDALNRAFGTRFRILKGIESDILADGSLDYPDDVLARFDFVVASVHSRFRLDRAAQTARILKAVSNPFTTILGHITGRLLLRRPGYEVDVAAILGACGRHGVAVEINGSPKRMELDWRWHQHALAAGCWFSINPDAHAVAELDHVRWGVAIARKGGVPKARVLNAMQLAEIARHLRRRCGAATPSPNESSRARATI